MPRYKLKLATRPMLTQSVTTALLFATGDIMAQQAVEKKGIAKHDFPRTGRMILYGGGKSIFEDHNLVFTNLSRSNLRTSSYHMVPLPPDKDQMSEQEARDRRTCRRRPACFRAN